MSTTRPDLRVGDAERDSVATALREHYAQGRLSTDELDERLAAAFSATTQGQLEQVTDDLPPIESAASVPTPPGVTFPQRRPGRGAAQAATGLLAVVALLGVVAIAAHAGHGEHVPRNIITLVIALLILRGLVFRAFGRHHHQHRSHQHWDHHEAQYGSEDDSDDDRSGRPGPGHHHEHHHGGRGHGYSYSYRYEYNHDYPGESR